MLIAVTEQWVLTYVHTQNHFIVEGTISGFRRLCSMVYTHIAAMFAYYYLHTWKSCLFICLTYLCSLSCLAQLWALYCIKARQTNYKSLLLLWAVGHTLEKFTLPPSLQFICHNYCFFIFYIIAYPEFINLESLSPSSLQVIRTILEFITSKWNYWITIKNMVKGSWTVLH